MLISDLPLLCVTNEFSSSTLMTSFIVFTFFFDLRNCCGKFRIFCLSFVSKSLLFSSADSVLQIFSGGDRFSKSVAGIGFLFDWSSLHFVSLGIVVLNMVDVSWDFDGMAYFFS